MKKTKTKSYMIVLLIVVCTVALMCAGCGKKKGASKKQIEEDIKSWIIDVLDYGLKIDKIDIEKRRTSVEEGVDEIWTNVKASNEYCTYTRPVRLIYGLYNEGWLLDGNDPGPEEITPKVSAEDFPQKTADKDVEDMGYKDYWLKDRNASGNYIYFKYGARKDGDEYVIALTYEFSPSKGWYQFTGAALPSSWY